MNEKNQILKASFWYIVSNFLVKGLGFITVPIFARILTKADIGYVNNFNSWLSMLTIVATLSLNASLVRARFDYEKEMYSFVSSNLLLGTVFSFICGGICLLNKDLIKEITSLDTIYITIMFINMLVMPAYNMFLQVQRFSYNYKSVAIITIGVSVCSIALSLVLVSIMSNQLLARILGGQIPTIFVAIIIYFFFLVKGHRIRWEYMKYSLAICCPYIIHLLSGTLLNSSDRAMITKICGPESTALYGMAGNIALIVSILWESLNTAFSPWLGEKLNAKDYEAIRKYTYGYILVFCFILIGIVLIAPEALLILGGKEYIEAKYVIPPMMYGYVLLFIYSMYVNIEQFEKKTSGMAIATFCAAVINIGLNVVLLPQYGYAAAAYTTVIGYAFLYVFHFFMVKKMGFANVYDTRFILSAVVLIGLIMGLMSIIYDYRVARYLIVLLYGIIAIGFILKNRAVIVKIIK